MSKPNSIAVIIFVFLIMSSCSEKNGINSSMVDPVEYKYNIQEIQESDVEVKPSHAQSVGSILPQEGNPINTALDHYKNYLKNDEVADKLWADIMVSYQFDSGAFPKSGFDHEYQGRTTPATEAERKKTEVDRRSLGTLDNGSTITELATLSHVYKLYNVASHKAAAQKCLDWLLNTQQPTGGWQQWYQRRLSTRPIKEDYSALATFNDDAMMRVLIAMKKAVGKEAPFDSDVFTVEQLNKCETAIEKGVDYILKSQIIEKGKPTVWCAQHDMLDYSPQMARDHEIPSKSGNESQLIVAFLMSRPQTPEITKAIKGALDWYNDPSVYVKDMEFVVRQTGSVNAFKPAPGRKMWYRFYELETNKPLFVNRNVGSVHNYDYDNLVDPAGGYWWAGPWGEPLLEYAEKVGLLTSGSTGIKVRYVPDK